MQVVSPFVVKSLADDPVKIGLDNPLTGTFAALGKNELIGAQLAVDQINANNGILGRKVELLVEDSTSGDTATAVQKADKLIDRDKVNFLLGNINSALAQAMANESNQKGVFTSCPAVTPTVSPASSVTGTSSASATPPAWKPIRSPSCCSPLTARSGTSSPLIMPSATRCRKVSRRA
jgi:ABC-type branched-subunit amino acid transport system substrate-binding protein